MEELFLNVQMIGDLYYHHIHLFYDEPLIFSCQTKTYQYYFVVAAPTSESADASWLIVPISLGRLIKAERNLIEIRKLITEPENFVCLVDLNGNDTVVTQIDPSKLGDDMLPNAGTFLNYVEGQELPSVADDTDTRAEQEKRDIIEISLEKNNEHQQEIPCADLVRTLYNVQNLLYAVGNKNGKVTGAIPKDIKERCQLSVSGMYAASVGIRLKSDSLCDLSGETPLTPILQEMNKLFGMLTDESELKQYLIENNHRIALQLRLFLKTLLSDNIAINFRTASPNNKSFHEHFTTQQLSKSLMFIESEISSHLMNESYTGRLTGVDVRKKKFSFLTSDHQVIHGNIDSSLTDKIFSLPQTYKITVEIRIDEDDFIHSEKLYYTLKEIYPWSEDSKHI